jgi:hypothetical protein
MLVFFALIASVASHSESRDPTTPAYPLQTKSSTSTLMEELVVSAIWISPKSRRATINGLSVKQGDTLLNSVKVMKIQHNAVTIEQNGVIHTLLLIQRPYIKKPGK